MPASSILLVSNADSALHAYDVVSRMMTRYDTRGIETEFEPGSRGRVLRNLLSLRSAREMSRVESAALLQAQEHLVDSFSLDHRFTAGDICEMHRTWLGHVYAWAGQYRTVNITKGDFLLFSAR